jgi:FAD/FMN-containing dehydrogenase
VRGPAAAAAGGVGVTAGGSIGVDEEAAALASFAASVGAEDPVCVVGGRTQWDVGGLPAPGGREVAAPSGVVSHQPEEMIVRVRAGTTVAALAAVLAEAGQMVPLDPRWPEQATVGGVLAVGRSGLRRLRYGPVRDTVLEARFVAAQGQLVKAGGPVVKNVTGFDLCRLLVGSLGTLGLLAEVVLRCYPVPVARRWLTGRADPFRLYRELVRPSAILWNGESVWVLLEGHPADVAGQARSVLGTGFAETAGPPELPSGQLSLAPGRLGQLGPSGQSVPVVSGMGPWVAEVGVGTVHTDDPGQLAAALPAGCLPAGLDPRAAQLQADLKARFDPTGRLNPGRTVG